MKATAILWIFLFGSAYAQNPPPIKATGPAKKVVKPSPKMSRVNPAKLPKKLGSPVATPVTPIAKPSSSTPKERRNIDLNRSIRVEYKEPLWNKSKTQVETSSVIIKDSNTSKMVRVYLSETEADSGVFAGVYSITWKEVQNASPEIYAVSPDQVDKKIDVSKLNDLKRLPYIFKKDEKNQLIEAFSTREEANRALDAYKAEQDAKLKKSEEISQALIETAERTKKEQEEAIRKNEERLREEARLKTLTAMQLKVEQAQATFKALSPTEQAKRRKKAEALAKEAMAFYQANQFPQAEEKFRQAFEVDPMNEEVYFYYGVTLYKLDKFNDSLVFLELAKVGKFNPVERDFLKGLNHYRLNEYEKALGIFETLKKSTDPIFGPNSSFYQGLVKMKMEKWDEAKDHFQETLDTSKDPALDQSAEDYIEKIERIKQMLVLKSRKWFLTGTIGMQYDSNVLLVQSSSPTAGDPSKVGDYRYLTGGGVEYRPIYEDNYEFSIKTKGDLIYSSKGDNVSADPLMYSIKFPYKYKGMLWGKGYKLEVVPGYEMLRLDIDRSGANSGYIGAFGEKEAYLNSMTLDLLNNIVINNDHIMGVNLKYRSDSSQNSTVTGTASDATATKIGLDWQNIFFFNQKKNLGLIGTAGYSMNKSSASLTYNRIDLSAMALFPVPYEFQGVGGISYYQASYPDKTPQSRTDNDIGLTLALSRPLYPWLNWSVVGTYTDNQSNLTANTYNKYLLMTVLTANWSL